MLLHIVCVALIFCPEASIPCKISILQRNVFDSMNSLYQQISVARRSCSLCMSLRGGHAAASNLSQSWNAADPENPPADSTAAEDGEDDVPVVYLDSDEMVVEDPGAEEADMDEQLPDDEGAESTGGELRNYADDSTRCIAHGAPVYAVALSPFDEDLVATGGGDDGVLLWSASGRGGAAPRALGGFADSVAALAFSHDGTFLAAGAMDATCKAVVPRAYDCFSPLLAHTLLAHSFVFVGTLSPAPSVRCC